MPRLSDTRGSANQLQNKYIFEYWQRNIAAYIFIYFAIDTSYLYFIEYGDFWLFQEKLTNNNNITKPENDTYMKSFRLIL